MGLYPRILCPIDGSATAECGMHEAIALAKDQGARLRFLNVVDAYMLVTYFGPSLLFESAISAMRKSGEAALERAVELACEQGAEADSVLVESALGRVAPRILEQARHWPASLIVIGTHGRRGVRHMMMGSDAEEVVRSATVPVLLVREPASPATVAADAAPIARTDSPVE